MHVDTNKRKLPNIIVELYPKSKNLIAFKYAYKARFSVLLAGPPPVRTWISSNTPNACASLNIIPSRI